MVETDKSYRQIVKSTGIFGGSQIITILIGIVRNKILAILLGAVGVGLISMYQNILDLIKSFSTFGIETSGVREIATIAELEDKRKLAEAISLIDKWSLIFASAGAIFCLLFSYPVSLWTFDDASYTLNICLLSICIFFSILAAGHTVVLHGLRRIGDMVKSSIIWNMLGLVLSIPLYVIWGIDGVVPAFIAVSIGMYCTVLYYRRKIDIDTIPISLNSTFKKGSFILKIGFFIVLSAVLTNAGFFAIRAFLSKDLGLYSVGLFQAAWSITNVYLMLILKSMGSDFYPRLCGVITDKKSTQKLINEQTYVVLIVSVPLIILLFLCSKFALSLLYSSEFAEASDMLRWQVFGTFFKVISWPLGFVLLAKGKGLIYFFSEMLFLFVYLSFSYLSYAAFGLEAVGIAYLIAYIAYLSVVYLFGRRLSDFKWTSENLMIAFISFILVLLAFGITQLYSEYTIIAGVPVFVVSLIYSLIKLNNVIPIKSLVNFFKNR